MPFRREIEFSKRQRRGWLPPNLYAIIQRENGTRKRADIPLSEIAKRPPYVPTTDPETQQRLRDIIRKNGH